MATAATQSYIDVQKILQSYRTEGVKQEESDQFVQDAINELDKDQGDFANNVGEVATWAIQVDEAFNSVTRGLNALVNDFGGDFPPLAGYYGEWSNYNQRWVDHLALSRDVASEHMSVLKRFDKIFITMVESIQTDQDRLDVIAELGQFTNEDHDRSLEMSQGFLNLKRDVEDFTTRFDAWVETTSAELEERAKELQVEIENINKELQSLDKQIQDATAALLASAAGAATMIGVIGLVVAGTTVAVLIAQRIAKGKELSSKKKELEDVNRKQKELAKIKSDFDGLRPDIALICEKLVLFAEIWSSVRSQTVQFQETLKGGMDALTNIRFKAELRLARELCTPLTEGLEKYATSLVKYYSSKK
ncbi:hypothetical protein DFP72DRAFT_929721 [Ephemerocybe angulata]|uniref:Uncharacterized protein n=1 Tax=Ephemerocybe angulata TaxID=980116 RepID=A0A8H6LXJ6_9AGAR|nr:hypothetical protein DFP72DRAFT_929721 [Tulosesus angulatus]